MSKRLEIQAIKVRRLYLQVAEQLQKLIEDGVLPEGGRLPSERELANRFGVSRPTVREAMIALEIAGLVEVRSGSGVYVLDSGGTPRKLADTQEPGPFEILEARKLVEAETCALAAERISAEQLQQLERLLEEMVAENSEEAITERADEKFHCLIAEAAGNSALAASITWLWQLRNQSEISTHFHRRVREEGVRPILADHQEIFEALCARDPEASRAAMSSHLQRVIDHLLESQ